MEDVIALLRRIKQDQLEEMDDFKKGYVGIIMDKSRIIANLQKKIDKLETALGILSSGFITEPTNAMIFHKYHREHCCEEYTSEYMDSFYTLSGLIKDTRFYEDIPDYYYDIWFTCRDGSLYFLGRITVSGVFISSDQA